MSDAIFTPAGGLLIPSAHAVGPWDPGQLHGGAPAALLVRAFEQVPAPVPMRLVRLSVAFLRAVPLEPLEVGAEVTRGGKRLQFLRGWVRAGGQEVLRAEATMLRTDAVDVPVSAPDAEAPAPPQDCPPAEWVHGLQETGFNVTGMEVRFARGGWASGPAVAWFRLAMPLVAGETPSPAQRVAAAADFGNGISGVLDFATHLFVNTDLTVHVQRVPVGEWVCVDARTDLDAAGVGQATSVLRDEEGRLGVGAQSLFVAAR